MTTGVSAAEIPIACASCGAARSPGAKFCATCGAPAALPSCPSCSAVLVPGARFCAECGRAVEPAAAPSTPVAPVPVAERRVASVLFGDLVGFTPLSETRDAEDVRELLSRYFSECRAIVARYGGTLEKFIGDAVMAVWGVPLAHEDDAERAVRAGLELTQAIAGMGEDVGAPGLAMRVGIVTGEVAVTIGATAEGMVAGDSVNTAARVQATADPGQVWVDATTRTLTSGVIAYEGAGAHALKGKTDPLPLFVARTARARGADGPRNDGLEAPLVGRARELRLLKEYFHSAEESHRPVLVVVDGEAGIGKSRLASEFERYVDGLATTVAWHRGRCLSYGDGVAFWALAEALRPRLGLVESSGTEAVDDALDEQLPAIVPDADEREWLRPRLAALLGSAEGTSFRREDLFSAWTTFLERVGGDGPVVLVLDDMQHADDGLLDFLDHLIATARCGIFVLALARPELLARRPGMGGRRASIVRLDALDEPSTQALLDALVTGLPADARAALLASADGVPLYLVEAVRSLVDHHAVVSMDTGFVFDPDSGVDVASIGAPPTLQALVAARLDALTADERRVVSHASVLGLSFTRDGLAFMTHPDTAPEAPGLDGVLSTLQGKEIFAIQLDRFSTEKGQLRFVQSVVRQVAYAMQSKRDRKARHLAAAEYLSRLGSDSGDLSVIIAQHLLDAIDSSSFDDIDGAVLSVRAVALLEQAASRARALGAPAEAFRLLETATARESEPDRRQRLTLAAAGAAHAAGRYVVAIDRAKDAMSWFDAHGEVIDAGVAAGIAGAAMIALQENAAGIDMCEPRWRQLDGMPGAERALVHLVRMLGSAYGFRGDQEKAAFFGERGLLLAEATNDPSALASTQVHLGIRYQGIGAPQTAKVLFVSAADVARANDRPVELAIALINLATIQLPYDLPAALGTLQESIEIARRSGSTTYRDFALGNYALALWTAGRFDELTALFDDARETVDLPTMRLSMLNTECWLAVATGSPLPAIPDEVSSDAEADQSMLGSVRLTHAVAHGDPASATAIAAQTIDPLLAAAGLEDDFMHVWPALVLGALHSGDVALADRLLAPVRDASTGVVSPAVQAQYLRLRALVSAQRGDDPVQVEGGLLEAIDALTDYGAIGHAACAQEELGRWLVSQGRGNEAVAHLEGAHDAYAQMGAHGWLQRLSAGSDS